MTIRAHQPVCSKQKHKETSPPLPHVYRCTLKIISRQLITIVQTHLVTRIRNVHELFILQKLVARGIGKDGYQICCANTEVISLSLLH